MSPPSVVPGAAMDPASSAASGGPLFGDQLSVPVSGRVFAAEVSPASSPVLLALGLRSSVSVLQLAFPEEQEGPGSGPDDRQFRAFLVREVNHDGRVQCLAWPHFSDGVPPAAIVFASGGADGKVRVFR